MKLLRHYIICVTLSMLMPAGPATATDTRVETLGDAGLFIRDDNNIWQFPSTVLDYRTTQVLSLAGRVNELTPRSDLRTTGIFPLPRGMAIGAAFVAGERQVLYAPLNAKEQLHLFYGLPRGNRSFGLRLSRYGAQRNQPPTYERSVSVTEMELGLKTGLDRGWTIEGALHFSGTSFVDLIGGQKRSVPDGYYEYGLRLRGFLDLGENVQIVPLLTASNARRGARLSDDSRQSEDYLKGRFGIGLQVDRPEALLLLVHASISYQRMEIKNSIGESSEIVTWDLPIAGLGLEKWLRPWLAVRAGAILRIRITDTQGGSQSGQHRIVDTTTAQSLGLAFRLDGLQVDFALESMVLQEGPYFLSGREAPLFAKVSLVHTF